MRAAYLGPAGTVSEEALVASGAEHERLPLPTLRDVVLAVQERRAERALVPVENALEGGVDPVLDALALEAPDVTVVGELVHPVAYCLAAAGPLALEEVRTVHSHPQAAAQCARWLHANLPGATVVAAASTAHAVRELAGEGGGDGDQRTAARAGGRAAWAAAIGTRFAAERYGAEVLASGVEDDPGNATRFAWLAPAGTVAPAGGARKTALVFWGAGSSAPGWLVSCLRGFADGDVNLTRIESRPLRRGMGEYMFFLDLDGDVGDAPVRTAVDALRTHAQTVRILGSFPAAATPR